MRYVLDIEPKPQSRPRFGKKRAYEDRGMLAWKRRFMYLLKAKSPAMIEKGPIAVLLTFYVYPPQYLAKSKGRAEALRNEEIYVDKRPDLDNYTKAVWDCSNGILFKDDGQIAVDGNQKLYSFNPRVELEIFEL
ncbi:RusA family crossover junction endodeoxyribonuclease [Enterococcus asini]|uniref:RusA family crossover junction endodeoxyribonuclease n=1 Tax=Enterococcus asini TaxID=57732 RepID=UPI0026DDB787|nr:RusA family crossover junction endodeoxyribonuclease [Enterococcus asini]